MQYQAGSQIAPQLQMGCDMMTNPLHINSADETATRLHHNRPKLKAEH